MGDLEEEYFFIAKSKGVWRAQLWYCSLILISMPSFLTHFIYWRFIMFGNYMKIAVRNIKRQPSYSVINIAGLTIGLICSLLILLWVHDEMSWDRYHEHANSVYRIVDYETMPSGEERYSTPTPPILASHLKEQYPEVIRASSLFTPEWSLGNDQGRFVARVAAVDADFLRMFTYSFLQGDGPSALPDIHSIVLTETLAKKLFGEEDPMGKVIQLAGQTDVTVRGVVEDQPENTHLLPFEAFAPIKLLDSWGRPTNHWGDHSFKTYIQLDPNAGQIELEQKIADLYQEHIPDSQDRLTLQPITSIHLHDLGGGGLITYVYLLSVMAGFILLIACINYMNLSTARSTHRAMEVGIRRAVGADRRQLILQFLGESVFISLIAMVLALVMVHLFLGYFNQLTGKTLIISYSVSHVLLLLGITLVTGLISGSYPAFGLSAFQTARILRGAVIAGRKNRFRRILVVFQFTLSIFLLIGIGVIYNQVRYLRNKPLGYDAENVLCMTLTQGISQNYNAVKQELLKHPNIMSMSLMNTTLDQRESSTTLDNFKWEGKNESHDNIRLHIIGSDEAFLETFRTEMAQGRFYSQEHRADERASVILNESAVRAMGIENPLETDLYYGDNRLSIIGVVKDFHFQSLHFDLEPLVILYGWGIDNIAMRIKGVDIPNTIRYIENAIRQVVPGYVLEYQFLDDRIERHYRAESRTESITIVMSFLALFIACLGLLGLASYTAELRTKEIGIRKVFGSSVPSILFLLLKEFSLWILFANIFAWPIAYWVAHRWLQNFAYRTTIGFELFIISGIAAMIIA